MVKKEEKRLIDSTLPLQNGSRKETEILGVFTPASLAIDPFRERKFKRGISCQESINRLDGIPGMSGSNASDATSSITGSNGNSDVDWRLNLRVWLMSWSENHPDHPRSPERNSYLWQCISKKIEKEWNEKEAYEMIRRIQDLRKKRHDLLRSNAGKDQIDRINHSLFLLTNHQGFS